MRTPDDSSISLYVVSRLRVRRPRNRSSIPSQDSSFLYSFQTVSGTHPASYAMRFEGYETVHLPPSSGAIPALPVSVHGVVLI